MKSDKDIKLTDLFSQSVFIIGQMCHQKLYFSMSIVKLS